MKPWNLRPLVLLINLRSLQSVPFSASHDQVVEKTLANKFKKNINEDVTTVKNQVQETISKAMDNVVTSRVEMAVRSIIE